jgi:hypothetical protein
MPCMDLLRSFLGMLSDFINLSLILPIFYSIVDLFFYGLFSSVENAFFTYKACSNSMTVF